MFLESFQSDNPLIPFLGTELFTLLRNILEPVVKISVMDSISVSSALTLDLDDSNILKAPKNVSIGFVAKEALNKTKVSEAKLVEFKTDCQSFYLSTAKKIIERLPLSILLVRNMDFLNPQSIAKKEANVQMKMFEAIKCPKW